MRIVAAVVASLAAWPCLAATIEVKVVGPDGAPVPKASVGIVVDPSRPSLRVPTDLAGVARIDRVEVGTWMLAVDPPAGSLLFSGEPGGVPVSVQSAGERVALTVPLKAGDLVRAKITGDYVPEGSVLWFFGGRGAAPILALDRTGNGSTVLPPGVWSIFPRPPVGIAWIALTLDGQPLRDDQATFETRGEGQTRNLAWVLDRPGHVHGKVSISGPSKAVAVEARLVTPGPWWGAAGVRGWEQRMDVSIGIDPDGTFDRDLAVGSWVLTVAGEGLLEADPPSLSIDVTAGGDLPASFRVRTKGDSKSRSGTFAVSVLDADGKPLDRAQVEVRALKDGIPDGPPVAVGASRAGFASMQTLIPRGDYVVAATHERALWSSVVVRDVEIEDGDRVNAEVKLRRGGAISGRVVADRPLRPYLSIRRTDPPVPTPFSTTRDESQERTDFVDGRGVGFASGLEPGRFAIKVVDGGPDMESARIRLRLPGGEPADELVLDVKEGETSAFEIVEEPAASATAKVECEDGAAADRSFEVRGYREGSSEPTFKSGVQPREGRRVVWGPLPAGRWRFELEPVSFSRTTWAPGTEIPGDAQTYDLEANGIPKDLGTIRIDCAPAAQLSVYVGRAGADPKEIASPDLRLARIDGRWRENDDAPWQPLRGLSVAASKDAIYVHKLPEGEGTVELTVKHPHLLDEPVAVATLRGKRDRGGLHLAVAEARGVGGAILYSKADRLQLVPKTEGAYPSATRVDPGNGGFAVSEHAGDAGTPEPAEPRIVPIDPEWGAAVSIAPGVYDVRACGEADPECARVQKLWSRIRVLAGSTIELR